MRFAMLVEDVLPLPRGRVLVGGRLLSGDPCAGMAVVIIAENQVTRHAIVSSTGTRGKPMPGMHARAAGYVELLFSNLSPADVDTGATIASEPALGEDP